MLDEEPQAHKILRRLHSARSDLFSKQLFVKWLAFVSACNISRHIWISKVKYQLADMNFPMYVTYSHSFGFLPSLFSTPAEVSFTRYVASWFICLAVPAYNIRKHVYKVLWIPYYVTLLWLTIVNLLICSRGICCCCFFYLQSYTETFLCLNDSLLPTPSPPPVFVLSQHAGCREGQYHKLSLQENAFPPNFLAWVFFPHVNTLSDTSISVYMLLTLTRYSHIKQCDCEWLLASSSIN